MKRESFDVMLVRRGEEKEEATLGQMVYDGIINFGLPLCFVNSVVVACSHDAKFWCSLPQ